jgi:hypothetical protein
MEFKAWPKIPRFNTFNIRVTEKIDGTNACICIGPDGEFQCQSRSKIITPEDDNYGFAKWAYENKESLLTLGHGYHYGEWYGQGIQRRYSMQEKRFALFNTFRPQETLPPGVDIVPILYDGMFNIDELYRIEDKLKREGSEISPGFMDVEGFVIYFYTSKERVKWIINK